MEIVDILKLVAPGTPIREGIDNILKAKTGGLIVIGDGKEVEDIMGIFIGSVLSGRTKTAGGFKWKYID